MNQRNVFRNDIQGLRAIAVLSVIIFHFGYLPNGYLGVDIFLVISGYLITGIIYKDFLLDKYSIKDFYVRRFRRIIPLVLMTCTIALILGILLMLPDDLENLAQSVISTNFFSNNILQYITTGNYWDVVNEYKPLLHTWSLGVEEQFYIFYPLLFLLFKGNKKLVFPALLLVTIISLIWFFLIKNEAFKFYMLPTRFFEISIGGIAAIKINELKENYKISLIAFVVLLITLFFEFNLPTELEILIIVICTCTLISLNSSRFIFNLFLENKLLVYLGTISFSLYMWHQLILAFYRYAVSQSINYQQSFLIICSILFISILSYHYLENYLRQDKNISTSSLIVLALVFFIGTNSLSFWIYQKAGVIKDFPELELTENNAKRGLHSVYNDKIYNFKGPFKDSSKVKVLVVGNSFARDWANVLLESKYASNIDLIYSYDPLKTTDFQEKIDKSDVIFFSTYSKSKFEVLDNVYSIDSSKFWIVGTKNFGQNNGIIYNSSSDNYCLQRVKVEESILLYNFELKREWGNRYIDLLSYVIDDSNTVPAFTHDCKFISQDTRHLTRSGAKLFSDLIKLDHFLGVSD